MIDRKELTRRHNPILRKIDTESPLTVGNGELAFTADITGFQTFPGAYTSFPLCTMSQWGWHTEPADGGRRYTLDDVEMTSYQNAHCNRIVSYAVERFPDSEEAYDWLRHNPHRQNLARAALMWDGREIPPQAVVCDFQELDLYSGTLNSVFTIYGQPARVCTLCAQSADVLGFSIESPAVANGQLTVGLQFPYGSHRKNASDWDSDARHTTVCTRLDSGALFARTLDDDIYAVRVCGAGSICQTATHVFLIKNTPGAEIFQFTLAFSPYIELNQGNETNGMGWGFNRAQRDCADGWAQFWEDSGAVDFNAAKDPRAPELERRVVLSRYLTAIQCAGSLPPQETGLSCNSWYGKFHLEMHILHAGWFPLWGHGKLLERSLSWYEGILGKARENAARNGYAGARWPKMIGPEGIDSPSRIATLLIWQQPHILYMLEFLRLSKPSEEQAAFMRMYWPLVSETAAFMCDFLYRDPITLRYVLPPPFIPAQEEHAPETVQNPVFELCYWQFGLRIAMRWAQVLGKNNISNALYDTCREILNNYALPAVIDGLYPAHENCMDTFTAYNRDHPSMLYAYGFIPGEKIKRRVMYKTAKLALDCWQKETLWGWDFALCAMTFTRLGRPDAAIDTLLSDTPKNSYTVSGNNYQRGREDLPLYLPGNGSLLMALAMMLAGYGSRLGQVGFPKNGQWDGINTEGVLPLPY